MCTFFIGPLLVLPTSVIIGLVMKNIIQFYINKGENYYVAQGVDLPVVTQGKTLDELMKNIKEAVELHLS